MILHTVGYPAVKLCNFVCESLRGDFGRSPGQARAKFQNFQARKFWVSFNLHVYTMYLPKVQEGGVLFFYFCVLFVFMFCAICNWLMNEWINQ